MQPEDKDLLKRTLALEEENNGILRKMQRSMRLASFMSFLYWIFIVGSAVGAYYLVQPYLDGLTSAYGGAKDSVSGILDTFK